MTIIETYADQARRQTEALAAATSNWWAPVQALAQSAPASGRTLFDPNQAWQQAFHVGQRMVELNARYIENLASAVQEHITGLAQVLNEGVVSTTEAVSAQAEGVSTAIEDRAQELERAERAAARQAKREAHDAAAQRYQDMTKVELAEDLGNRDLPKTGNVEELRERLIAHDLGQID